MATVPFTLPDLLKEEGGVLKSEMKELFYLIAYCDTYHDFSGGERKRSSGKEEEGETMNISFTGIKYPSFILNDVIPTMDPESDFPTHYGLLNDMKLAYKDKSYENAVYRVFTSIHNPVINALPNPDSIKSHFTKIFNLNQGDTTVSELLASTYFNVGTGNATDFSTFQTRVPIYDIKMERIVYTPATVDSFINFLKKLYSDNIDSNDTRLKFVEDASSFPREIFINTGYKEKFKKIQTTQSRWDSGGYSGYVPENQQRSVDDGTMPAYSFHTLDPHTTYRKHEVLPKFSTTSFKFNPSKYPITLKDMNLATKCGPSVNHLILHIIATQLTGEDGPNDMSNRTKAINLIKKQVSDSKKNIAFDFVEPTQADRNDLNIWKAKRLRELTTYKRSGDYENILSALKEGAVLFTGDEAAFVFAMLVQCPAVLHTRPSGFHNFRFYIPPGDKDRSVTMKLLIGLQTHVCKANELTKLFAATDTYYNSFIENIQTILASPPSIVVGGDSIIGSILRILILQNLIDQKGLFIELQKARDCWKKIIRNLGISETAITNNLTDISKLSNYQTNALSEQYTRIQADINTQLQAIEGLSDCKQFLDETLAAAHANIPRKSYKTKTGTEFANPVLFEQIKDGGKDVLFTVGDIKHRVRASSILPQYNEITTSIGVIAKTIKLVQQATGGAKTNYRFKQMNSLADTFEEYGAPTLASLYRDAYELPDPALITDLDTQTRAAFTAMVDTLKTPSVRGGSRKTKRKSRRINAYTVGNTTRNTTRSNKPFTKSMNYASIHKSILTMKDIQTPFGLTNLQYADLITERLIILDVLSKALAEIPPIPVSETIVVENEDPVSEPTTLHLLYPQKGLPEQKFLGRTELFEDPLYVSPNQIPDDENMLNPGVVSVNPEILASGGGQIGGAMSSDFIEYWTVTYTDVLYPFILKHFNRYEDDGTSITLGVIQKNIVKSVQAQTFIEDMMIVLEELSLAPTFVVDVNADILEAHNAIVSESRNAIDGLFNQYNTLFELVEDRIEKTTTLRELGVVIRTGNNIRVTCGSTSVATAITELNNNVAFDVTLYLPKIRCLVSVLNGLFRAVPNSQMGNTTNLAKAYLGYFQSAYGETLIENIEFYNNYPEPPMTAIGGRRQGSRRRNPRDRSNRRKRNSCAV